MGFQSRVGAFLERHDLLHTPETHALDLAAEVGEVAKALLEVTAYGSATLQTTGSLESELGDALFSLAALAESLDVDLEAALAGALARYEARIAAAGHPGSEAYGRARRGGGGL
ncbi:MAG: MazG-like family protein [Anaerolineae bacterium]|jgi:NTP pyrophosphatase (non-canonical NTP hydrolase)